MRERRLERDEGAHAVAHQRHFFDLRGLEEGRDPARPVLDRRAYRAGAAPMPGEIHREDRVAVMREVARLPLPDAVVERGAVDEHERRQLRVERAPAGVGVRGIALDDELHR